MAKAPTAVSASDLNNDGWIDLVYHSDAGTGEVGVMLANAGGLSFQAPVTYAGTSGSSYIELRFADLNSDGQEDLVVPDLTAGKYSVYLGTGSGTFSSATSFAQGALRHISLGDFNEDGKTDIITNKAAIDELGILLGNGNGTFGGITAIDTGPSPGFSSVGDFNGDGHLDLVVTDAETNNFNLYFGNGNGTFKARVTHSSGTPDDLSGVATADVDSDGALDLIGVSGDASHRVQIALGGVTAGISGVLSEINLSNATLAREAVEIVKKAISDLGLVRSGLGASQSRLEEVITGLHASRTEHMNALSLIEDADVAEEAANLVRYSIRQQQSRDLLSRINSMAGPILLKLLQG